MHLRFSAPALFCFLSLINQPVQATGQLDSAFVSTIGAGITPEGYPTFDNGTGAVNAVALQSTGKILAGGNISKYNNSGALNPLKRVNADGSQDTGWNSGGAGFADTQGDPEVNALLVTSGDKVYAGGVFQSYNGTARSGILRLNADGSLDTSFAAAGVTSAGAFGLRYVHDVAEQTVGGQTKVLIAGGFDRVNGVFRKHIARLNADGSLDASFNCPAVQSAGNVWDVEVLPDGRIIASASTYNAVLDRNEALVIRLFADGSLDPGFSLALGDNYSLINKVLPLPDGRVVCGGTFSIAPSSTVRGIGCFNADGSPNTAFNNNLGTGPNGWNGGELVLTPDGSILAGGIFTSWNGVPRASIARLASNGTLDAAFDPQPYLPTTTVGYLTHLYSFAVQPDGKIVAGGWFHHISDIAVETFNLTRFTADFTPGPGTLRLTAPAYTTAENSGSYTVGVSRSAGVTDAVSVNFSMGGGNASNGTDYTASSGTLSWANGEGGVKTITIPILQDAAQDGDKTFIVSLSSVTGGATLATPDSAPVLIRDDDGPPVILVHPLAMTLEQGNNFAVTCFFDSVLPATIKWQFDSGSGFQDIPGATSIAYSVSGANPALHAGQYRAIITNANGAVTSNAVTVTIKTPAGSVVTTYASSLAGAPDVSMLDTQGRFIGFNGTGGIRVSTAGVIDTGFTPTVNSVVSGMLPLSGDRMLIAGFFTTVNGIARNYLARLEANGALDASFNVTLPTFVTALAAGTGGKFYVGLGSSNGVRRYNADGTQDNSWNGSSIGSGTSGYVWAIRELPDGRVFVAHQTGNFGQLSYKIELFSSLGAVVPSFVSPSMDGPVTIIEPLPDGRVVVMGRYTGIGEPFEVAGGSTIPGGMVILAADGRRDDSFMFGINSGGSVVAGPITGIRYLNGRLLVWGEFIHVVSGATSSFFGLVRVNLNGSMDSAFSSGAGGLTRVTTLQVRADGDLVAGGTARGSNGGTQNRIVRLEGSPGAVSAEPFAIAVQENAGTATVTIKRYGPHTGAATVDYRTSNQTAVAPGDYTTASGTLTWAAGDMTDRTVTVPVINDTTGEPTEVFRVFLENTTPVDDLSVASTGTVTIIDDDNPPSVTLHPVSQTVGQGINVTFTAAASAVPAATVQWTRDNVDLANGAGISGVTTTTLSITAAGPGNAGLYRARFTSTNGSTTSNPAQLAIALNPSFADTAWPGTLTINGRVSAVVPLPDGGAYAGGEFTNFNGQAGKSYLVKISASGVVDTTFAPAPNAGVAELRLDDDRLYVRGSFANIGGGAAPDGFAALDATTGARLTTFMTNLGAGPDGIVRAIAVFPDGDVLLGGDFTSVAGDVDHRYLSRLNPDGTRHAPFDTSLATGTAALVVTAADVGQDGRIVAGGTISYAGGSRLIRFNGDGSRDASFAPTMSGSSSVSRIRIQSDGRVMASGGNLPGGNRTFTRMALDGSWASTDFFGASSGPVNDFDVQRNGRSIIGGQFSLVRQPAGSGNVSNIARFDATGSYEGTWASGIGTDNTVAAVAIAEDGKIWLGGDFLFYNGTAVQRLTRLNGDPVPLAITLQPKPVNANPATTVTFTARATGTSAITYGWRKDGVALTNGGGISGANTAVLSIANVALANEGIYTLRVSNLAGEEISAAAELVVLGAPEILAQPAAAVTALASRPFALEVTARGIAPLTWQWRKGNVALTDGAGITGTNTARLEFASLTPADAGSYDVVVTGTAAVPSQTIMLTVLPHPADRAPAFMSVSAAMSGSAPGLVRTVLPLPDGGALAGGGFNSIAGASGSSSGGRLARILPDGTVVAAASVPTFNGDVWAIARQPDGKIIVGGAFQLVGGQTRNRIARLNANLTLDTAFDAGAGPASSSSPTIQALAVDELGRVYAGGDFDSWAGRPGTSKLVRLRDDGTFDPSFIAPLNGTVQALAMDNSGGLLVAGAFSNYHGGSNLVRLLDDGTRDSAFAAVPGTVVNDLAIQPDGMILAAQSTGVRRYLTSGALDPGFAAVTQSSLGTVAVQPNGLVLGGGSFSAYSGTPRGGLARLSATGALDTAFDPVGISGGTASISQVRVDGYGRVWLGGSFTQFNGSFDTRSIAVLNGDPVALGFVEQPADVAAVLSQTATFSIIATGTSNVTYQWQKNGVPMISDGRVLGVNTATLSIANLTPADVAGYTVVISNASGIATSDAAQLILLNTPELLIEPAGATLEVGQPAEFYVKARGAGTLTYEWLHNNQPLANGGTVSGAASHLLSVSSLVLTDGGTYAVRVSNAAGSITSTPVTLTVNRNPAAPDRSVVLPVFNNTVSAVLPLDDGSFFAGGLFTTVTWNGGAASRGRFARIKADGSADLTWPVFANGQVNAIAKDSAGKIYIGGSFTSITPAGGSATTRNRIVRLNSNGTLDTTFDPAAGAANAVNGVRFDDTGRVYIFGDFGNYRSEAGSANVARLTDNGSRDAGFVSSANATIYDMEFAAGGKIWLAHANAWGGQSRIVLVDDSGVRDPGFTYTGTMSSRGIGLLGDGSVLSFSNNSPFVQKISAAGSLTMPFPAAGGPNGQIVTHAAAGSQFYVNGAFTTWGGVTANTLARINADGSLDATFDAGSGFNGTNLDTIVLDSAGRVWCGGSFISYRGDTSAARLVVLNGGLAQSNSGPPADPFGAFMESAGVPANQRGANDDPDGDGIHNLMEYALDLAPMANSTASLPVAIPTATHLTLTYRRFRADVTYSVEAAADTAAAWSAAPVNQGTPAGDDTTTASIPLSSPENFLRLRVTLLP